MNDQPAPCSPDPQSATGAPAGDTRAAVTGDLMSTMSTLAKLLHQLFTAQPSPVPGIETAQLVILAKLGSQSVSVSRLAELAHSEMSTVSRHVNRLVDAGLATKTSAEHDRRVQVVTATERGRDVRQFLLDGRASVLSQVLADFTTDEVATLDELLSRLAGQIDTHLHAARA